MLSIHNLETALPVFRALGSELRVRILDLVCHQEGIPLKDLHSALDVPSSTLAPHIHMLEECGLLKILSVPGSHGTTKCCFSGRLDKIAIYLDTPGTAPSLYKCEVPIGHYSSFRITPTCGLAAPSNFIGQLDEPRYFAHPDRYQAEILWFTTGYLEYMLPNLIPRHSVIDSLSLSFEISSEAPGHNNTWPSDITFSLCDQELCTWTSPGDYGDRRGRQNPSWWYPFLNQYGLLKTLRIDRGGTFMDGERLSDITVRDLALTDQSLLNFRISVHKGPDARGCTLFGRGFGDHPQALQMEIRYHEQNTP